MNTTITLGELLMSKDESVRRNAIAILKRSQKLLEPCTLCDEPATNYVALCADHAEKLLNE